MPLNPYKNLIHPQVSTPQILNHWQSWKVRTQTIVNEEEKKEQLAIQIRDTEERKGHTVETEFAEFV